jgi:hypothetical protein
MLINYYCHGETIPTQSGGETIPLSSYKQLIEIATGSALAMTRRFWL